MAASIKKENSIFFNHSFDKKRLKALISWVFKRSGEAEALRVLDLLKEIGFRHATKAGISIGLHDLTTPIQKSWLISESQISMNTTDRDFAGARITATERSQRIIDTWHRASESLSKQVVDYFGIYDQFNPVYIMALSGARGNFSQVRQLIGMRGLMADQQGKIVNFPIRSNLREGLTLTEYFISCSGARKGLVDTALRTADTGYLTRRLVDVSHHVVVKRIRCNTNRGIAFESLQSYNKIILALKERLVGRVLAEDIEISASCFAQAGTKKDKENNLLSSHTSKEVSFALAKPKNFVSKSFFLPLPRRGTPCLQNPATALRVPLLSRTCPFLPCPGIFVEGAKRGTARHCKGNKIGKFNRRFAGELFASQTNGLLQVRSSKERGTTDQTQQLIAKKDQEISQKLSLKIASVRDKVFIRSPLTCGFTHSVCQLCYGWSISQGSLVSLGDAVGVIAAQSIGEPGTQLTMRTFHTGGVFSGDLLQEIRAPHAGTIRFSKAFQGLLIRSAHGRIAFLSKMKGSLILSKEDDFLISSTRRNIGNDNGFTEIPLEAFTMLFVRQGEKVEKNQLLAEFSIQSKEGNQPIKTQQTIFSELSGRVVEERSGKSCTKSIKESILLSDPLPEFLSSCKTSKNTKQKINKKRRSSQSSQKAIALIPKGLAKAKPFRSFRAVFTNPLKRPRCKNQGFAKAKLTPFGVSDKSYGSAYRKTGATLQSAKSHCRLKIKCTELQKNGCSVLICKEQSLVEKKKPGVTERVLQHFNLQGAKIVRKAAVTLASKDLALAKLTSLGVRTSFALAKPEGGRKPINGFFLTPVNFRGCKGMHATEKVSIEETKKWKKHNRVNMRAESFTPNRIEREICIGNQTYAGNRKCKSQISSFLKNEDIENDRFKYIEPPKSGRLGFLKIISTRIGATLDYTSPIKPSNYHLIKRKKMQKHVLPICHVSSCFIPLQIYDLRTKISWWQSHLPLCVPYKCLAGKKIGTSTAGAKKESCRSLFREGKASHFSAHILDKEDGQVKFANPCFAVPVPVTSKVKKEEQFTKNGQSKGKENFYSTTIGYGAQFNKKTIFFPFSPLQELEKSVKYLHPEYIQENRFILQTIAEYGDIVEETYKTKTI